MRFSWLRETWVKAGRSSMGGAGFLMMVVGLPLMIFFLIVMMLEK